MTKLRTNGIVFIFFKILFIYSGDTHRERERERERERKAETQAEGEAGSLQWAWCGTWSQDPKITTWAEGRHSTTEPPRAPPRELSEARVRLPAWVGEAKQHKAVTLLAGRCQGHPPPHHHREYAGVHTAFFCPQSPMDPQEESEHDKNSMFLIELNP